MVGEIPTIGTEVPTQTMGTNHVYFDCQGYRF
jgi:hypothetical protein